MKAGIFLVALLASGGIIPAYSAQLDVDIPANATEITPSYKFLRIVNIEYPEGGQLKDILNGKSGTISFSADKNTQGISEIISQINLQLSDSLSGAFVSDVTLKYQAILNVGEKLSKLEYNIQINPMIQNPSITIDSQRYVDTDWRGIKLAGPILIQTEYGLYDINNPESALKVLAPKILSHIENANAKQILNNELLDASGIKDLALSKWHSLFDPTGILEESELANFKKNSVVTYYSMGECTIILGVCDDREWNTEFALDKKYKITAKESRDDATISLEGYGSVKQIGSSEVFGMTEKPVDTKPGDGFPVGIIYGMAAMAAVGGVAVFVFSNRKLKQEEGQGQRGIDPSQLRAYSTHEGAGGYRTVRGEAQLVNDSDYQKTRSVYDEKSEPKPSRGSLPKDWK